MSSNTPPDKTSRSNIDTRYEEVEKLMRELDDLSDHFDSDIPAQDPIRGNNVTLSSYDQNNRKINNSESFPTVVINPRWGFIQDKELYREKEKLLKNVVI